MRDILSAVIGPIFNLLPKAIVPTCVLSRTKGDVLQTNQSRSKCLKHPRLFGSGGGIGVEYLATDTEVPGLIAGVD